MRDMTQFAGKNARLLLVLLVAVDLALAPSPRGVEVVRRAVGRVRVGEPTTTTLDVVVTGRRRARGLLRDAWQPSAGATGNRQMASTLIRG